MIGKTLQGYLDRKNGTTKTGIPREMSRAMRGWTKYGGANKGYSTEKSDEWYCQACTDKQTIDLPSYLIQIDESTHGRICSKCFHEAIARKMHNIFDLISFMRRVVPDF